jgi:obg-like ATPase 1
MPPKKTAEPVKRIQWGRPSNTLKMGLVGLPNVGKSTTFNVLTKCSVPASNFPFCTIDPHEAIVEVPDARFDWLAENFKPGSLVKAKLTVWDIAGLVPNAHKGEGLGNAFLSNIQGVDGIYHVCRAFQDDDVIHTEGEVNPVKDLQTITNELIQKDLAFVDSWIGDIGRKLKSQPKNKEMKDELDALEKSKALLDAGTPLRCSDDWTNKEVELINKHHFLTTKPVVYLCNMSPEDFARQKNKYLAGIKQWVDANGGGPIIPYSAAFETKLIELETKEAKEKYLQEIGAKRSMLDKIIQTGYEHLELIHFFTVGETEVRCWTVRKGAKAPEAAGTIHSDFERGFICADVYKYEDIKELGNESEVKAKGKIQQAGKTYEVIDGDICHFKFNVSNPSNKK